MTSASRPTWSAAVGAAMAPTFQYSSRDLSAHTKLKLRALGQDAPEEVGRRDLRAELLRLESQARGAAPATAASEPLDTEADADVDFEFAAGGEAGLALGRAESGGDRKRDEQDETAGADAETDADEDEDEDDTDELLRELEKIKKEREAEQQRRREGERAAREGQAMRGNPLLAVGGEEPSFAVRRRWDDDVVFKNQHSGVEERPRKRFINDTTRSDFHRKFLDRYIK